jgi:hypothetical protein
MLRILRSSEIDAQFGTDLLDKSEHPYADDAARNADNPAVLPK